MDASIYKQFALARTAFLLFAAALFMILPSVSRAETNPAYTVEGVEVDVTAENAVKAREKALDEAQVKAYKILAERFLGAEAMAAFTVPDALTVSTLVQDFEVTKEQLSKKRYKGTYTIRFRPNAMKSQMAAQGKTYIDTPRKPVLVLPFYEIGGQTALWNESNPWLRAWRALPADADMMRPVVLPLGDAEDIAQVADEEGLDYDPMRVQELAGRYDADDVAVVMAVTEPTQTEQGRVAVNIYTNGFNGPAFVQKLSFDQAEGETPEQLYLRAAEKVRGVLRQDWKANAAYNPAQPAPQAPPGTVPYAQQSPYAPAPYGQAGQGAVPVPHTRPALGPVSSYNTYARFASVQDWVRMKSTLDRIYGVQAVMIKALKPREALLDIRFAGDITAFQLALQNAGIGLRAGGAGPIEIYMGGAPQTMYR